MSSSRGNRRRFGNDYKARNKFSKPRNYESRNFNNRQFFSEESFTENQVGIMEYINKCEGFSGIIKARYSDFHVNEINNSGEIAKLTDLSIPADFVPVVSAEVTIENTTVLPAEVWTNLRELSTSSDPKNFEIDAECYTKEQRTKIHESIRNVFGKKIVANTKIVNDKKVLQFRKHSNEVVDNRFEWPQGKGEYVYFLVYKEAVDTMEASYKISDCARMKSSAFTYAGVKDKRAKTTQWFCVKKIDPKKLINCTKYLRKIHIGNISFRHEPLKLGQLQGNRFQIALRNVTGDDAIINTALESLQKNGFINYYGLQRFGADKEVPTFKIGIELLKGNWKEACNLILNPKKSEDPSSEVAQAKRVYKETGNSDIASKKFSKWYNKCVESKLLLGFVKNHEKDCVNALENIPRNMRLMYLHSFQSLVWNKIVSRRIKEFGLKPIIGDIVLVSEAHAHQQPLAEVEGCEVAADEETENVDQVVHQDVKILTEIDLDAHSIYDIVLPLPGYDIKYPQNKVKDWYKEILEENGLSLEFPKQKVKTYNLSGAYRKIVAHAKNLTWKMVKYNHPNDTLIRSDYEELIKEAEPKDNPDGQYKGLTLDFCLDSSCYATMVLREILKMDTSVPTQAKLNDYHTAVDIKEPGKTEIESIPGNDSLLSNPAKYEEFKQQIFASSSNETSKHTLPEDENCPITKKLKSEDKKDASIKIQPSLV